MLQSICIFEINFLILQLIKNIFMKAKTKKTFLIIFVAIIVIIVVGLFILHRTDPMLYPKDTAFNITDTSAITKIFIADKMGNSVVLSRTEKGWLANDTLKANNKMINEFMRTMYYITLKSPVPIAQRDNVLKRMSSFGTKVEIYARVPWARIGSLWILPKERKIRTFYVGDNPQDKIGTFFLMEGAKEPYIMYMPGMMGFLQNFFSPKLEDWRDHTFMNMYYPQIHKIEVTYYDKPENSFTLIKENNENIHLLNYNNEEIPNVDLPKVRSYMSGFVNVRFAEMLSYLDEPKKDSILQQKPYCNIRLTGVENEIQEMTFYKIYYPDGMEDSFGRIIYEDHDILHGYNKEFGLVTCQYYVVGSFFQPISYFIIE